MDYNNPYIKVTWADTHDAFTPEKIKDNAMEFMNTINKLKPSAAKGTYVKSVYISSTMSPGIQVEPKSFVE